MGTGVRVVSGLAVAEGIHEMPLSLDEAKGEGHVIDNAPGLLDNFVFTAKLLVMHENNIDSTL